MTINSKVKISDYSPIEELEAARTGTAPAQQPKFSDDAKVLERDVQGNPTVYEDEGQRKYAPGSTLYERGFRTEEEYRKAQLLGANLGANTGNRIPADTIVYLEGNKPVARFTNEQIKKGKVELAENSIRYPVVNPVTRNEVLLTTAQLNLINAARTPEEQLAISKELGIIPKSISLDRFIATSKDDNNFIYTQELKRFERLNTKLPDGQYVSNKDIKQLKEKSPEIYKTLTTKGLSAANKEIDKLNNQPLFTLRQLDDATKSSEKSLVKQIWQSFTPWDEDNQTFTEYMKDWPVRFIENFKKKSSESQLALKAQYDIEQKLPLWAKALSPQSVFYDKRTKTYYRVAIAEVPDTGKSRAAGAAKRAVKQLEKVDWSKVKEAVDNARLRQAVDKAKEAMGKAKWKDIEKALDAGKARDANVEAAAARAKASQKQSYLMGRAVEKARAEASIGEALRRELGAQVAIQYAQRIKASTSPVQTARFQKIITLLPSRTMQERAAIDLSVNPSSAIMWTAAAKAAEIAREKINASPVQQQKEATKAMAAAALSTALQLSLKTNTSLQTQLENQLQNLTDTQTKTQVKQAIKTITSTPVATKTSSRYINNVAPAKIKISSPVRKISTKPFIPIGKSKAVEEGKKQKKKKLYPITFYHGRIRGWITIYPPYGQGKIESTKSPPKGAKKVKGGIGTAYRTIQSLGGDANVLLEIDSGNKDIIIRNPSREPGKKGAIKFVNDPGNKTKNPLTLKGVRVKK